MPLKALNTLATALGLLAADRRRDPRAFRALLGAALVLDLILLFDLTTARGALATAATIPPGIKLVHVVVSAFFPLLYPLLLVSPPGAAAPDDPLPGRILGAFLGLRLTSFLTSYFMVV